MSFYNPTYIKKYETGLVESRQNFILPDDAYPILENAFVWRERIKRKPGYQLLGRLKRTFTAQALGVNLDGSGNISNNIKTLLSLESNSDIELESVSISDGTNTFTDDGAGVLTGAPAGSGTINYSTMAFTISGGAIGGPLTATFNYYPSLPCMGLRPQELNNINAERTIAFDTTYAYRFVNDWEEWIPGTTWTGSNSDFFWTTNYWVGAGNQKIFWATNFSGTSGDPIRYTNGSAWIDFAPQIDSAGNMLHQCLAMLPFKGRMLTVNTFEGATLGTSTQQRQRIRWAAIGNPFTTASAVVTDVNADAWRDDIPGQGGFLDIPTSQNIISMGFVRDNLVIFCERSTWQLRHTGRSIAPFQIERVNDELGAESTFSAVEFDKLLVGIGDKGVVQCDSFSTERIDTKIPDLIFRFNNLENGTERVYGIRDYQQRIAYWTYTEAETGSIFPNRRLVYNYDNDSWAIFKDSFTCLGTFQSQTSDKWEDFPGPEETDQWQNQIYPWVNKPALFPSIVGGNQQGYVEYLGQLNFKLAASNDISLTIKNITGNTTTATTIESPNHNLQTATDAAQIKLPVIRITGIPSGTPFDDLNGNVFGCQIIDENTFNLFLYDSATGQFSEPQLNDPDTYVGGGRIEIRDNFRIKSKEFNYLEQGQAIQFGYMDITMAETDSGAITMNVYTNYNENDPVNQFPENDYNNAPDTFFNIIIPTYSETYKGNSKNVQRVNCNLRGSYISFEFTFSNAQMNGDEVNQDVQIDNQIIYTRPAGRQLTMA